MSIEMSDADRPAWAHAINGKWIPGETSFEVLNPSNGRVFGRAANAGTAETKAAIDAAADAFTGWSSLTFDKRAAYLRKAADIFERRADAYIEAMIKESGSTFAKSYHEALTVPEILRTAAAMCYNPIGQVLPSRSGKHSTAVRSPMGVISVISPWNFPGLLTARGFAYPLAAGNTIVLKPSEETPYVGGIFFAEVMMEAGLPEGVFNVVTCDRDHVSEVGDLLVEHTSVKGISFTGSTPVGRGIAAKAASLLKKCCVELGGKDNLIIRHDADLDRAVTAASFGGFFHQGQICMSVERVLVHDSLYEAFLSKFSARSAEIPMGAPEDKGNSLGPMINAKQTARVKAQLDDALAKGATLVSGGTISGNFIEPTVLTGVTADMDIYAEETFGPVVPVMPFGDDAEAISIANDTAFGLSAGIFSADEMAAEGMAAQLHTGMCHINCSSVNDESHVPFGGAKASGLGRHGGQWSMETFTELRWITHERGGRVFPPGF